MININKIIQEYNKGFSIRSLSLKYNIDRFELSELLKINDVEIRNRNQIKFNFRYNSEKYKTNKNNERYVAIDKNNPSVKIYDVNNKSGKISKYLKETYSIETPNVYQTHKYFMLNGEYWYEKYFIFEIEQIEIQINKHMHYKPFGYWNNKDNCFNEAKKYRNKYELQTNCMGCYNGLRRNGWLDEADNLFFNKEIQYKNYTEKIHLIYVYEFNELNSCYVGRTSNLKRRHRQHNNGTFINGKLQYDSVKKFSLENGINELKEPIILECKLNAIESQEKEEYWLNYYKDNGWNILNKASVGINKSSLGATLKWTYDKCKEIASMCKTRNEMKRINQSAYNSAKHNKWLDELLPLAKKENGYWNNFDNCQEVAKECKGRKDLFIKYPSCYNACRKNGFLDKLRYKLC